MEGTIPRKCQWDRYGVRVQAIPGLSLWDTPGEELARGRSEAPVGLGRGGAWLGPGSKGHSGPAPLAA